MKLNKNHPDCAEYRRKWEELTTEYKEKIEKIENEHSDYRGLDNPYTNETIKEFHKKIKELQSKYAYLYTEE